MVTAQVDMGRIWMVVAGISGLDSWWGPVACCIQLRYLYVRASLLKNLHMDTDCSPTAVGLLEHLL